jgi:hypothetical protein
LDWVAYLGTPALKMQGTWTKEAAARSEEALLASSDEVNRVIVRGHGGAGAGSWLLPTVEDVPSMPDPHFRIILRRRLRLPVCPAGARCKHRRANGTLCNAELDAEGLHALTCNVGTTRDDRHNTVRDWSANVHQKCTGVHTETEQHVPVWDRINPRTRQLERAILDVATRDPRDGRLLYLDARVTCELSDDRERMRARANRDGAAARQSVNEKHNRYPSAAVPGSSLAAFVLECGGRPADETAALVRYWGSTSGLPELSTGMLWQQLSTRLQLGNAECILSALGSQ